MPNPDTDTDRSTAKVEPRTAAVTDGGDAAGKQAAPQDGDPLLSDRWEKLAVGSGSVAIVSVLFLPVLSLNLPAPMGQLVQSAGENGGMTLRTVQSMLDTLARLGVLGGESTTEQLSAASTATSMTLYGLIGSGLLLIAGAAKKRVAALVGAVIQTLLTLGLLYGIFLQHRVS